MNSSVWAIWTVLAVRKKSGFEYFWATFEGAFLTFCVQKTWIWKKKYLSNRTKKFHKKAFMKVFFDFFCLQKVEKIGCNSRFYPECNTKSGLKESLYIALGNKSDFWLKDNVRFLGNWVSIKNAFEIYWPLLTDNNKTVGFFSEHFLFDLLTIKLRRGHEHICLGGALVTMPCTFLMC